MAGLRFLSLVTSGFNCQRGTPENLKGRVDFGVMTDCVLLEDVDRLLQMMKDIS